MLLECAWFSKKAFRVLSEYSWKGLGKFFGVFSLLDSSRFFRVIEVPLDHCLRFITLA